MAGSPRESLLPLAALDFEILACLEQTDLHGYALAQEIARRTGDVITPGLSSLYVAIRRLTRNGLVADAGDRPAEGSGGPPRRYYRITRRGRDVARLEAERLVDQARRARRLFLRTR